jgi:hypothetical protein
MLVRNAGRLEGSWVRLWSFFAPQPKTNVVSLLERTFSSMTKECGSLDKPHMGQYSQLLEVSKLTGAASEAVNPVSNHNA